MSSVSKRVIKPSQRPRKRLPAHLSKLPSPQALSGDGGIYSNPILTYHLARCFLGNVGEIHTSTHRSVGVIKAVSPNGGFGMECVRSTAIDSVNGPFELENYKLIQLSDIKKIVLWNVDPLEIQKEDQPVEDVSFDDPGACLQHYFTPNEDAEDISLASDDNFPPEDMFAINEKKYNVTSTYNESLDGYTVPLDKNDPEFKAKEEYFEKVAQEIDEIKSKKSPWDSLANEDTENEELKYSAVLQEGVPGRELKSSSSHGVQKSGRCSNRSTFPRDAGVSRRSTDNSASKQTNMNSRDQTKKSHDSTPKDPVSTSPYAGTPVPVSAPIELTNTVETSTVMPTTSGADSPKNNVSFKQEKKKTALDPDAPEFKPSGMLLSVESNANPQILSAASFPFNPYPPAIPCSSLQMHGFTVAGQQSLPNGCSSAVPFCLSSSMPYLLSPAMTAQLASLQQPQQVAYSPHQLAVMNQFSMSGSPPTQPTVAQSANGSKCQRQTAPSAIYGRHRPVEQSNSGPQQIPLPIFPPQGFSFQPSSYPISVPLIPTVSGPLQQSAYNAMHALAGTVPVSQSAMPQAGGFSLPAQQSVQVAHTQSNPQQLNSANQGQGPQFHAGYNPQLCSIQGQPAAVAYYPHYSAGQLIGSQGHPVTNGFCPRPPSLIQFPIQQLGANGQSPQIGTQMHHQNQQTLLQTQPIQLQPTQQQGPVQNVQQHPQAHILVTHNPYLNSQAIFPQTMGVPQPNVQNAFTLPQNVHSQPLYTHQPSGTN